MEQEEWKQIYEIYQRPLFLYALSLTKNIHDAEDLLQETFIKAFLSYEKTGSIKYWLVTVLRNEFCNLYRKRKREILDGGNIQSNQEESEEKAVIDEIIKQEERKILFYAIQELPIMMKEVLMESTYFHMKDEEIAKMHGITRENVRKIRSRAKQKLIERLEGES